MRWDAVSWKGIVLAGALLIGLAITLTSDLWLDWSKLHFLEWDTFGAAATFLAVIVALSISDSDRRNREKERRAQAIVIAIALCAELGRIVHKCRTACRVGKHAVRQAKDAGRKLTDEDIEKWLAIMELTIDLLDNTLMKKFIDKLDALEHRCQVQLFNTYSDVESLVHQMSSSTNAHNAAYRRAKFDAAIKWCDEAVKHAIAARAHLRREIRKAGAVRW